MAKNEQVGETSHPHDGLQSRVSSSNPENDAPLQSTLLIVCKCFRLITAASALLCIAVNVLAAVVSFRNHSDVFDGIFRIYAVAVAVFVVVAEIEWTAFFNFCKVLEYWPGRGMLQIFVAVMTRAFPNFYGQRGDLALLQNIASFLLLFCGVVYVVSGILCIGCLKRKLERKEISTREQTLTDLELSLFLRWSSTHRILLKPVNFQASCSAKTSPFNSPV